MPRGRRKVHVAPCRFCSRTFKRQEHKLRHERTHTREKPYACDCGQLFARQDLLRRHARLSHKPSQTSEPAVTPDIDRNILDASETDLIWAPELNLSDIMPDTFLNMEFFTGRELEPRGQLPTPSNRASFNNFTSSLPRANIVEDGIVFGENNESPEMPGNASDSYTDCSSRLDPWSCSGVVYDKILSDIQEYVPTLPVGFTPPTCHYLCCGMEVYFRCAQKYLPFIHIPTFAAEKHGSELLLAIAAIGQLYRYEKTKSYGLYFIAEAIFVEKKRREQLQVASNILSEEDDAQPDDSARLQRMQTLILLMMFSSWADQKVRSSAVSMGSELAMLAREHGIYRPESETREDDWLAWIAAEERRRTLLAAYIMLNLQSFVFDIPPLILNADVGLLLPDFAEVWEANDAGQWKRTSHQPSRHFLLAIRSLFDKVEVPDDVRISPLSNYILIHGILQRLYLENHSSDHHLSASSVDCFERALSKWQASWETTENSDGASLDPHSTRAPISLMAAALLRLAYLDLYANVGSSRSLYLGDRMCTVNRVPTLFPRSPGTSRAVLFAAHALSVPVRIGVDYMATTKTSIWCVEHSICSLKSALVLRDWLEMISLVVRSSGGVSLQNIERKLLGTVKSIIKETSFAGTLDIIEDESNSIYRMANTTIRIWAGIFQGTHVFTLDNQIGWSFKYMADSMLC
ncbi:hypothetical protein GGR57DRAFT_199687 [Xylariaceae sp. FL1272]|nr:hypothetical protein GGR57DRAFT_199687 [Xylariaceae sp. FL1272]